MRLLFCAFALAATIAAPAPAQTPGVPVAGKPFLFKPRIDSATGTNRSTMGSYTAGSLGLTWRCMADGMNALVVLPTPMVGDAQHNVLFTYRLDQRPPIGPMRAELGTNNRGAFIPATQAALLTASARRAARAIISVTDPSDGTTKVDTISMTAFGEAFAMLNDCK